MKQFLVVLSIVMATLLQYDAAAAMQPAACIQLKGNAPYRFVQTVPLLANAIPEQPSQASGPGVFYRDTITVTIQAGQRVLLAGSEEDGGFRTDDVLRLKVAPGGKKRTWDFRSADRMRIIATEGPKDLTRLFTPGVNTVTFMMRDLLGPLLSSSAYFLLIFEPCNPPAPAPTATLTPVPSATATQPAPTPTATATMTTTPQLVENRQVQSFLTRTATPLPTSASTAPTMMENQQFRIPLPSVLFPVLLFGLYGLLMLGKIVLLPRWKQFRRHPRRIA